MLLMSYQENHENCCQKCCQRTLKNRHAKAFDPHIIGALIVGALQGLLIKKKNKIKYM